MAIAARRGYDMHPQQGPFEHLHLVVAVRIYDLVQQVAENDGFAANFDLPALL